MGKKLASAIAWTLVVAVLAVSQSSLLVTPVLAEDAGDIEDSIENLESKLKKEQAEKAKLEQNLGQIQSSVYATQRQINQTKSAINQTSENISRKEAEIVKINERIELQQEVLKSILQQMYYAKQEPILSVVISKKDLSEVFGAVDNLTTLEDKIREISEEISGAKTKIEEEKINLAQIKEEHEETLGEKVDIQQDLLADKAEVASDVAEKEASIGELQEKLNELKSDLNKLLGKSYDATDVKDAIRFASKSTGVRAGFLFGLLSIESRLGASVGGCDYKGSKMSAARLTIFKDIAEELGYNYKKLKVSCAPSCAKNYCGTGGAMGAAQFMSDTWKGYKPQIAASTGHNPPDPWNLTDGVMAMALKLKNDGATKSGKTSIKSPCNGKSVSIKWEDYAALRYLGWSCYGLSTYAPRAQALSKNYDKL